MAGSLVQRMSPSTAMLRKALATCGCNQINRGYITGSQGEDPEPLFLNALKYPNRIALKDQYGNYTYEELFCRSQSLATKIKEALGPASEQERVAYLCTSDITYVTSQWAVWMAGHIGVPLSPMHPPLLMNYMMNDSESSLLLFSESLSESVLPLLKSSREHPRVIPVSPEYSFCATPDTTSSSVHSPEFNWSQPGLIVYTSGTTGRPKGVVLSHQNLYANVKNMVTAWGWTKEDNILHILPLNHVHGIIISLMVPLQIGAKCTMLPKFDALSVWNHFLETYASHEDLITVFTGVPTVYYLLVKSYRENFSQKREARDSVRSVCEQRIRLMMSGSASLPTSAFHEWAEITGHELQERYGMTEAGVVLCNPLRGERKPGYVGNPLPTMKVRIETPEGNNDGTIITLAEGDFFGTEMTMGQENKPGEILVQGPSVFQGYWNRPMETADSFTRDGWFRTGDTAMYQNGSYKILGRTSVDIIKTGGYKVSALEVESVLLTHPSVNECAVIGIPDGTWGQKVTAVVVIKPNEKFTLDQMKTWIAKQLPPYAIPKEMKKVNELPKNAMGKINKKELITLLIK